MMVDVHPALLLYRLYTFECIKSEPQTAGFCAIQQEPADASMKKERAHRFFIYIYRIEKCMQQTTTTSATSAKSKQQACKKQGEEKKKKWCVVRYTFIIAVFERQT
jgi:hypothetical protein